MLELSDICKQYRTGDLVQTALDHVSLNLRENEFVAILGPSGSGKTTLLNVIGGLDRYDSGDLIINGVSTKAYRDRDWDSYRNHTIGFVFQSYNLIPHQTVLANVELALTISGISGKERKERAIEALEKVGLGNQLQKLPNQMSGGQMQRVAIARALVNNPDILLADEPTGALDTENSIQIMNLLKEVASDRLVVMVTHNPDLAKQYATRIVNLRDGKIVGDTDPFEPEKEEDRQLEHRSFGKSSMNFLTALQLSFNNLRSKMKRTLLVSFAGSIGIVGIGLVKSLSNGVNSYIQDIEEQTLSEYPMEIMKSSFSVAGLMNESSDPSAMIHNDDKVHERQIVYQALSELSENDLASFRKYLESEDCPIDEYATDVEYLYDVKPLIYSDFDGKIRQVNPDTTMDALGFSGASMTTSAYTMSSDSFFCLPSDSEMYESQYQIKAGRWPENSSECVLVLTSYGNISDLLLYTMGLKDASELDDAVNAYSSGTSMQVAKSENVYDYDDFLNISFRRVNAGELYQYDEDLGVWISKAEDEDYVKNLVEQGQKLTIVGVAMPQENSSASMLQMGIYYPYSLMEQTIAEGKEEPIVQSQLADQEVNVLTGKRFDDTSGGIDFENLISIDQERVKRAFSINTQNLGISLDSVDYSGLNIADQIDYSSLASAVPSMNEDEMKDMFRNMNIKVNASAMETLFRNLLNGYLASDSYTAFSDAYMDYLNTSDARTVLITDIGKLIAAHSKDAIDRDLVKSAADLLMDGYQKYLTDHGIIPSDSSEIAEAFEEYLASDEGAAVLDQAAGMLSDAVSGVTISEEEIAWIVTDLNNGYSQYLTDQQINAPASLNDSFEQYISGSEAQGLISSSLTSIINLNELEQKFTDQLKGLLSGYTQSAAQAISSAIETSARNLITQVTDQINEEIQNTAAKIPASISVDKNMFASAITLTMNEDQLMELFRSLLSSSGNTCSSNLSSFGYAEPDDLSEIVIYPKDFANKKLIQQMIADYNQNAADHYQSQKKIVYTDIVASVINSVTSIVNAISTVLIGFVAISLVVSSIMIGVITYISVLERKKEIGILRALGSSKHNVSSVFNAETFIIGLLAGLMGIGLTMALNPLLSYLIYVKTEVPDIHCYLSADYAAMLVGLSVVLTLLGGFIPARKAAASDPVKALRT
ncbi:MAG: ATP-binding cassette domain-containing protein, partial [Bulleidia sp.]